jgi:acyl-[acyl-carrier-protein]-phospholipid O-acyltransferase / long-chain-fatty-acid--[acyl-carrier-protein] ligase
MLPLDRAFVQTARRHPLRFFMADARVPQLRFGAALARTVFLARRLRPHWEGQPMVGLLLPPSVAGAVTNLAATLMGKVPVNLNYTASREVLAACAAQCGLRNVVTSRAFLERYPVELPVPPVYLEDVAAAPGLLERLRALAASWLLPVRSLGRWLGREKEATLDDLATVVFSSGSTGDPKGVMLTHGNLAANVAQIAQVFAVQPHDCVVGILPFFHAFGLTVTLWLPAVAGIGVAYHPNPLDARAVGELVERYSATLIVATPTFLQAYVKRCSPEQFRSLEFVIVGAEKMPARLAQAFEQQFGKHPVEGYGCTECAPVVSVNGGRPGGSQGTRPGSIGRPLPGMSARIVHPDTLSPVPVGAEGLLLLQGPNVMKGYLGRPEQTAEVLRDGWYATGDIATMDAEGFLTITDRVSRFSKIGGEMVPHLKVEEKLHQLAGLSEQAFVVAALPDEKKGERLVVLHTLEDETLREILQKLPDLDLPPLWRPRATQFYRVDALPYLGTGKLDLRRMRELAAQCAAENARIQAAG